MKRMILILCMLALFMPLSAQNEWRVSVNTMDTGRQDKINQTIEALKERDGDTRSVLTSMLIAGGQAGLTAIVDVVATEVVRLVNLRKTQKEEWLRMIERECNYTDSISSLTGLEGFYKKTSSYGALDPTDLNFDGISVRGIRDGKEVLFLSCHIDDSRLNEIFEHSKFGLVIDTMAFYPYACHLPNLRANGIVLKDKDSSERDNRFSYDEREHLTIGMELILTSSWINQAVMVMKDVELGRFKMQVTIPSGTEVYTYSRERIDRNRAFMKTPEGAGAQLDTNYVYMSGESFVVPRSFMPVSGGERMWGTGEYAIKVKFREACQFSRDATRNQKLKHWKKDYKQLMAMRKKGNDSNYFQTLWKQNGNTLMKTVIKQSLSKGVSSIPTGNTAGNAAAVTATTAKK